MRPIHRIKSGNGIEYVMKYSAYDKDGNILRSFIGLPVDVIYKKEAEQ